MRANKLSNVGYLSCILLFFEAMSGLRVSFALIPISDVPHIHLLAHLFGCGVDRLLSSYIGLPLGATFKSISIWDYVVERFHKRLAR